MNKQKRANGERVEDEKTGESIKHKKYGNTASNHGVPFYRGFAP